MRPLTIATTGTNGKTTTTTMVAAIVGAAGQVPARVTTLGHFVGDAEVRAATLADAFVALLRRARERGVSTLALEVTSHALALGGAAHWPADVAVFTNLTRDHLDHHGSPEAYLAAKAQLFLHLEPGGTAVLNADDPSSALLGEVVPDGRTVLTYGAAADADLSLASVVAEVDRLTLRFRPGSWADRLGGGLTVPVTGRVHAWNAMAAALASLAAGLPAEAVVRGLATFQPVAGRFQVLSRAPLAVVDYAHTPDGLAGTLEAARALVPGRILLVFGCGGERDPGKRPEMGRIADDRADVVFLTTDNPRSEDPAAIAAAVRVAAPRARWVDEPDRRRAIRGAVALAGPGDAVLVAGKGHETEQALAAGPVPFSDAAEVLDALRESSFPARTG